MVEGPGCTSNGRKARSHVGRQVVGVNGQAAKAVAPAVRGRHLVTVLTLGEGEGRGAGGSSVLAWRVRGGGSSMQCMVLQMPVHLFTDGGHCSAWLLIHGIA